MGSNQQRNVEATIAADGYIRGWRYAIGTLAPAAAAAEEDAKKRTPQQQSRGSSSRSSNNNPVASWTWRELTDVVVAVEMKHMLSLLSDDALVAFGRSFEIAEGAPPLKTTWALGLYLERFAAGG